jgi:hypothetical protein
MRAARYVVSPPLSPTLTWTNVRARFPPQDPIKIAIRELSNVWGIGNAVAKNLVREGARTLEDLKVHVVRRTISVLQF